MTDPTPTELIDRLHRASFGNPVYVDPHTRELLREAQSALEAQLAETEEWKVRARTAVRLHIQSKAENASLQAVIGEVRASRESLDAIVARSEADERPFISPAERASSQREYHEASERVKDSLEALEAVKADTPAPPAFVNSVPNDGKYEYTSSSDCDGSNPYYRARVPARHAEAGPWFPISAEDYVAASKNWRGDWLPVETEGESRG